MGRTSHTGPRHRLTKPNLLGSNKLKDASDTALITASNVSRVISVLALTVLLGRALGPDAVGQISVLLATAAVLQAVAIGGISGAAIHKLLVKEGSRADSIQVIIAARFILIPIFYSVGLVLVLVLTDPQVLIGIAISLFFIGYGIGTFDVAEIIKTSEGMFRQIANRRLSIILSILPVKLAFAAYGNLPAVLAVQGAEAALWQLVLLPGSGIAKSVYGHAIHRLRDGFDEIVQLKSLWLSSIAAVLGSRADIFIVASILGTVMVGQYSTASRLVEAATILAAALATVMLNKLTAGSRNGETYARKSQSSARAMLGVGVACTVGMVLVGPWAVTFLYGDEFALAAEILPIYAICLVPIFQRQLISKFLIIEKEYSFSLWSNVSGLVINIVLNAIFIPLFGIWGAVYAHIISYTASASIVFLPTRRGRSVFILAIMSIVMPIRKLEIHARETIKMREVRHAHYERL